MNQFISDYLKKLKNVASDQDVIELYHWFWDRQSEIKGTANQINQAIHLSGDYAVKPDLPCLTMGSRGGLVFLLVNPGWNEDLNRKEDKHCRRSKDGYVDYFFNNFIKGPQVLGKRISYVASMISFVGTLRDGRERFGDPKTTVERWKRAQSSKLIGHWELFPLHSKSDGLSQLVSHHPWLSLCMKESLAAAVRLQPETLLIMSKFGWNMVKNEMFRNEVWSEAQIGKVTVSYCLISGKTRATEVIAIPYQVLSARQRPFRNQQFFDGVDQLRETNTTERTLRTSTP
jgi:hypothetical protein